jgi:hypothetical protein
MRVLNSNTPCNFFTVLLKIAILYEINSGFATDLYAMLCIFV